MLGIAFSSLQTIFFFWYFQIHPYFISLFAVKICLFFLLYKIGLLLVYITSILTNVLGGLFCLINFLNSFKFP